MKLYFSLILLTLASCGRAVIDRTVNHIIISRFTAPPVGIHEQLSRKYYGILENGDTVPISENQQIGDTIKYKYYHVEN